jgi:hypothetical protein
MVAGASPHALQYMDKANQVTGNTFVGIGNRAPHTGLRSQMHYGFKLTLAKEAFYACSIGQIERDKPETGPYAELSKPRMLEPGVVVVVQVVYPNHFKPLGKKPMDKMGAYKTSRPGDQDSSVFRSLHFSPAFVGGGESVRALAG